MFYLLEPCGEDDKYPSVRTRSALYGTQTQGEWYHSPLLQAIYSQESCCSYVFLSVSVSVSVLYSGSEETGSLVVVVFMCVCVCVGPVSCLECFIELVCLVLSCQTAAVQ